MNWYWEKGDRVYHPHNPERIGTVIRVVRFEQGCDDVQVHFDNAKVAQWFEAYWLRRASNV